MYPSLLWQVKTERKAIYLTFDDGPCPKVTDAVLDVLKGFNAKATFFCLGKNVELHPKLFERIVEEGHQVGNHTYGHSNGKKTNTSDYVEDYQRCKQVFKSDLFRPPYGRMKRTQLKQIIKESNIVMWDVLSGDFDAKLPKEQCLNNVISKTKKGSIVTFHDSLKSKEKVLYTLPKVLEHFSEKGYRFEPIQATNF